MNSVPTIAGVRSYLKLMDQHLERKKNVFEPSVTANKGALSIMMLAYYRNNLTNVFLNEAIIMTTLASFGMDFVINEGVLVTRLWN
jgi:glycerol-3-phosphate O-acyltransferase